jgi:FlhB-like protein
MSSEKTEEPTPRRLKTARSRGDLPVAAAVTQTAAMLGAVLLLPAAAGAAVESFSLMLQGALTGQLQSSWQPALQLLWLGVPFMSAAALLALVAGLVQTGGVVAPSKLTPKLEHLDPIAGVKNLFTLERAFQAVRALLGALVVGWLCWLLLRAHAQSVVNTLGDVRSAARLAAELAMQLVWLALGVGSVFAAIDWVVARRAWLKRNRMSKHEIQREFREAEGDPHQKQERRRAHQEMLQSASLTALKEASVLIINPTHFATALRYDRERDEAPSVVAQGRGDFARQLIEAARAYNIPIVRDVPVARALSQLQLGDEIPEELYEAVAEILRELWQSRQPDASDAAAGDDADP